MSGHESIMLYVALVLAVGAAGFSVYQWIAQQKRQAFGEVNRSKTIEQLNNEMAALKREHAHLNETVSRFRAQSLAGITETINEREKELGLALKESLDDSYKADLALVTRELDIAMEALVERLTRLEKEKREEAVPHDNRADVAILGRKLEQLEGALSGFASAKDLKTVASAQVIDRFLSSLEDNEQRFKCLLASFDSVSDSATLGKLAVAYPCKNSWVILKELSEHGVVSEVAAWAMVAGARLSAASGDEKMATQLYQGARHSFITCGGNHDGLWVINRALAKLSEGTIAEGYAKDAMANIFALKSNIAQSTAPMQLSEFYQKENRPEVAATLLAAICELYLELDSLAYQACLRVVASLGHLLLTLYQAQKSAAADQAFSFLASSLVPLKAIYGRCVSLDREAKVGLLLAILHMARTARDGDSAILAGNTLLDACQPQGPDPTESMADDFAGKIFTLSPSIYESLLVTLDSLELTRKKQAMPILERLTAAFMDINSLTRASSCGAKLVDCALESYGDAAAETVGPIVTLAAIYRMMQRNDLVEECFRQVLEIQYKIYTSESEEIVETMVNLSDACRAQNDIGEADIFLESAIETGEQLVAAGKSSDKLAAILNRARTIRGVRLDQPVVQMPVKEEVIQPVYEAIPEPIRQEIHEEIHVEAHEEPHVEVHEESHDEAHEEAHEEGKDLAAVGAQDASDSHSQKDTRNGPERASSGKKKGKKGNGSKIEF